MGHKMSVFNFTLFPPLEFHNRWLISTCIVQVWADYLYYGIHIFLKVMDLKLHIFPIIVPLVYSSFMQQPESEQKWRKLLLLYEA